MSIPISKQLKSFRELSIGMKDTYRGSDARQRVEQFEGWMDRAAADDPGTAGYDHAQTVREYYDMLTEFMVFAWGESLHFAPLSPQESLEDSKIRHQRLMISKLELREGSEVIDVGCGIGGPMRRVAAEAGVKVLGVNSSEYQLKKAESLNAEAGIDHRVDLLACSFMDMGTLADNTFDAGYAIESTCHAPDKQGAFTEIFRVLKPGSMFWGQEMCMTDEYDPDDGRHQHIKNELMHGIALHGVATTDEVDRSLEAAGFEVLEGEDHGVCDGAATTPWYQPMAGQRNTLGNALRRTPLGRRTLVELTRAAVAVGVFPKGSREVVRLLDRTANAYLMGGKTGIFTPLYCFLARKPA